jgi:predicted O-methyltransferase YrrM
MSVARRIIAGIRRRLRGAGADSATVATPLPPDGSTDVERLAWNRDVCSWPTLYYTSTVPYFRACAVRRVAEVGVAYGYHADAILTGLPTVDYVGVDPYLAGYDEADLFVSDVAKLFGDSHQGAMDRLHDAVGTTLDDRFGSRAQLVREPSVQAARRFVDGHFDAVFIDGDHRYEAVVEDLAAWWPKVRPGGSILGDDYAWEGVRTAWHEFAAAEGAELFLLVNGDSGYTTVVVVKPGSSPV